MSQLAALMRRYVSNRWAGASSSAQSRRPRAGLPICSPNRRSFCAGPRSRCAIEQTGRRGGQEDAFLVRRACRAEQEISLGARGESSTRTRSVEVTVYQPKKKLPASPPPCFLEGSRDGLSAQQQPDALGSTRPWDATVDSASDLRLGSHEMCGSVRSCAAGPR